MGSISRNQLTPGTWRALARFRDDAGVTRQFEARAATGAKAERKLIESFTRRAASAGEELTAESRLSVLAAVRWAEFQDAGKAINAIRRYKEILDKFIVPGLGALRIREARVSTLDRFLKSIKTKNGGATAKLCRTLLS